MHHGKHDKKRRMKTSVALAVSLVLLLVFGVGGTLALLVDETGPLKNLFTPSQVKTEVTETRNGTTKSDVKVKNTGDTTAWIRAAVVITWQDAEGNVYGELPVANTNYTISYSSTDWLTGNDGFYYYTKPVAAGSETGVLINNCTYVSGAPEGCSLCVEIVCAGIQYKPASVFKDNWDSSGLTVSGDRLVKKGATT